jgi:uncharacterized protein HemX
MGVTAVAAVIGAIAAVGGTSATIYSAGQQRRAQHNAETQAREAQQRADAESARLAAEAEAEAQRLSTIDAEVKRKAAAAANRLPSTIATSFSGLKTPATVAKKKLLGE